MNQAALQEALGQIVAGVAAARRALREPLAPVPDAPPEMEETGPDAPSYDPATGRVTADYYVKGHMGAQKNAVYAQWAQCWQIYSMMGAKLEQWVMAAPPADKPELASPSCIDDNLRYAWEMNPPWMAKPA